MMTDRLPTGIDPEAIARLRRFGGDKLLFEMIELFMVGGAERLTAAIDGIAAGDTNAAERALHSLTSSAGQLGALALQKLCARGEQLAAKGNGSALMSLAPELEAAYETARERLQAIQAQA